jgi:hypothetical protein
VSLIGLLEQYKLSIILNRVEVHAKTGLLIVRHGSMWVEFYFRDGLLMCIGPLRTNANLGERLLQDGVISAPALREALNSLGSLPETENNIALTLLKLGYVNPDQLRTWTTQRALDVLNVLLAWDTGEIHFEDNVLPPSDRLLVALSISSLLAVARSGETLQSAQPSKTATTQAREKSSGHIPSTPTPDVARIPTLRESPLFPEEPRPGNTSPFSTTTPAPKEANALFSARSLSGDAEIAMQSTRQEEAIRQVSVSSLIEPDALPSSLKNGAPQTESTAAVSPSTETFAASLSGLDLGLGLLNSDSSGSSSGPASPLAPAASSPKVSFSPPQPATTAPPSRRVDTSHMRPDMILMPADLSKLRDRNMWIQLTPNQWRLLTKVDGRTSLRQASEELSMPPPVLCQIAGELAIYQLIQLLPPDGSLAQELSPTSREFMASGLGNGYVAPGYSAVPAQPWNGSVPPTPESTPQMPSPVSFATESQWGNGGNGASFIPGRGWVTTPQPPQAMSPSNRASLSYTPTGSSQR